MSYNITLNKRRLQAVNMPEKPIEEWTGLQHNYGGYEFGYQLAMKAYELKVQKAKSEAIDFRPEDRMAIEEAIFFDAVPGERRVLKEGETYPVPDGFEIEIVDPNYNKYYCAHYENSGLKKCASICTTCKTEMGISTDKKYARLVPIKEQKPILFSEKQVEQIVFAFCEWKDNWTGTTFSHPPAINDRWLRFQETGDYDKALKRITDPL